jgi:hypothetical protein
MPIVIERISPRYFIKWVLNITKISLDDWKQVMVS